MKTKLLSITTLLVSATSFAHVSVGDSVTYEYSSDRHTETLSVIGIDPSSGSFEYSYESSTGKSGTSPDGSLGKENRMEEILMNCAPFGKFSVSGTKVPSVTIAAGEFTDVCHYVDFIEVNGIKVLTDSYYSFEVPWSLLKARYFYASEEQTKELIKFNKVKE